MKKRLLWSAFAMTVLVLLGFFAPLIYWRITGLVRGEAFYAGKPSCYWRKVAKEQLRRSKDDLALPPISGPKSWRDSFQEWKNAWFAPDLLTLTRMMDDPDAMPVWRDLFHDLDKDIRAGTALVICSLGEHAPDMIPEMIHYLMFDAEHEAAGRIVVPIGKFDSARAVPLLCQWLDRDDRPASTAAAAVQSFGPRGEEAIPWLLKNMEKENDRHARLALPHLGPKAITALKGLLKSGNVHARRNATWTLAVCYEDDFPDRAALLVQQSTDPIPPFACTLLAPLLTLPEQNAAALASLTNMLHDPEAKVRIGAIGTITNAYTNRDGPEVRSVLAEFRGLAVFDENAEVRAAAKNAVECARGPYVTR